MLGLVMIVDTPTETLQLRACTASIYGQAGSRLLAGSILGVAQAWCRVHLRRRESGDYVYTHQTIFFKEKHQSPRQPRSR